jgi:oligopeptide/dipeptide ABC transporter ATP-binding protein
MSNQTSTASWESDGGPKRPLLDVQDLRKHYMTRRRGLRGTRGVIRAVDGVSFTIDEGETLGLVGESGCGKSTLARTVLLLEKPTGGQIRFEHTELSDLGATSLRKSAQMVFQDPYSSLPPRMRVGRILMDPLLIHRLAPKDELPDRVRQLLRDVGLAPESARKLPHELSGGQRQRVGIARALAVQPSLIVADEAVSSLDASVQAQILNLMREVQARHRLSYLFISHDLGIVKYMSHRIAVMYLGEIVEMGAAEDVFARPLHPYTRSLLSATPTLRRSGRSRIRLQGEPPDPANPPSGCKFHPRCPMAQEICRKVVPELKEWLPGRVSACHFALDVAERLP